VVELARHRVGKKEEREDEELSARFPARRLLACNARNAALPRRKARLENSDAPSICTNELGKGQESFIPATMLRERKISFSKHLHLPDRICQ
jgi:hypothetical protein